MKGEVGLTKNMCKPFALFFVFVLQLLLLSGCGFLKAEQKTDVDTETDNKETAGADSQDESMKAGNVMRIKVSSKDVEVIFELNDSSVAKSFYEQLPLTVSVENYGNNEKIFEPSKKLDTGNVWEGSCPTGSIAYFSPWNNIAMYYGDAPEYQGLYPMGNAVDGAENIGELEGDITVTADVEN